MDDQTAAIRPYSPIIEEGESRPASTDPIEDSSHRKQSADNISIRSRAMSQASAPSGVGTPIPGTSAQVDVETAKEETKEVPKVEPKVEPKTDVKPPNEPTTTTEPIFKPLHTEKGKSKTTGKSIGGWI